MLLFVIAMQILPVKQISKYIEDKEFVETDFCDEIEKEKKIEKEVTTFLVFNIAVHNIKTNKNHFPLLAPSLTPHPFISISTPPPNAS